MITYIQRSGRFETKYGDCLWRKALRCFKVSSDDQLKSLYVEGLLIAIPVQVHHHLTTHPNLSFMELTRYAEGCGTAHRGGKKYLPISRSRYRLPLRDRRNSRDHVLIDRSSESEIGKVVEDQYAVHLEMAVEGNTFPSPPSTRSTGFISTPVKMSPRERRPPPDTAREVTGSSRVRKWVGAAPAPPDPQESH